MTDIRGIYLDDEPLKHRLTSTRKHTPGETEISLNVDSVRLSILTLQ